MNVTVAGPQGGSIAHASATAVECSNVPSNDKAVLALAKSAPFGTKWRRSRIAPRHDPFDMIEARPVRLALLGALFLLCLSAVVNPRASAGIEAAPSFAVGIALFATGIAIGGYGTVVGIGGGPLLVPILHFLYAWPIEDVVASSLFVVFLNATSGSIGYARQRRIDVKGGLSLSLAAMPGAVLSGLVHHLVKIPFFDAMFGVFLVALAVYTILRIEHFEKPQPRRRRSTVGLRRIVMVDAFRRRYEFHSDQNLGITLNLVLGFLSGFLGIGGGVLQVPILVFLLDYPIHIATATSHFVTMITAAFALAPNVVLGNVHFWATSWLAVGVVLGAQVGARIAQNLRSKVILYLFAVILLAFALKLFLS
jgi:uncharacterized membrane protein YfcA